ncbi:hypothetical protein [Kiritimatiella glycovorans]|uniref:Outer membrane protein beta-barrel domain-containing protein n=1 Tax=Kiritimatiella glycovorans TaxID=1307763 RepID=A0A0G3EJZ1_9BACT|nr:hypothetical protein [Kiritimatiella glycovorans]AKJ65110.1 hypothetical protein L21SP4_01874 [Kiritimatiella glycovorans]
MKKVLCVAFAAIMMASVATAAQGPETSPYGIGYQGQYAGEFLSHASLRMRPMPIGGQLMLGHWSGDFSDVNIGEGDLYSITGKILYSLVENNYSDFYVGAELGYWDLDAEQGGNDLDADDWLYGPLMGAEWFFSENSQVGFNFEVAYMFNDIEVDTPGGSADVDLDGVNVTMGIHYYF